MLILDRKEEQAVIVYGKDGQEVCRVIVSQIKGKYSGIKLGFEAEQDVRILRAELVEGER